MTDRGPEHIGPRLLAGYVMRDYDQLTATLARSRESQGISQGVLAERLDVTQAAISRWLSGSRLGAANLPFDLAHALGYDLALIPREDT